MLTAALFGGFQFSLLPNHLTDYELQMLVVGWSGVNVVWWICEAGIKKMMTKLALGVWGTTVRRVG